MFEVGSVVAGYRVVRVLGRGGMGAVYVVENPELPRLDALKVLSDVLSSDPNFRARFIREADVASRLDHPNIVSIYRRGETAEGQLWMAMQFIDGVDADAALQSGQMTPERAVHIIGEVAKALDYAHARAVIHRDVKPANMLLSGPAGVDERVLLGDFGIARALDDVGLTGTGEMMATVSYAAPEVISGGRVDGRADLYSLGCSLFRLLSGRSPFEGLGSQAATLMAHLQAPPPRVTEVAPWLPAGLDAVLTQALAKDPGQRFGSGAQLAAAATAALRPGGMTQPVTGPTTTSAPSPWQQSTMSSGPVPVHSWQPPVPAPVPDDRRKAAMIIAALAGVIVLVAAAIIMVTLARRSGPATPTAHPTTTTASKEPMQASALPELLLSPSDLANLVGSPPLAITRSGSQMGTDTIADKDCESLALTSAAGDFADSGYKAVRWQDLSDSTDNWTWNVGESVVLFPDAHSATNFLSQMTQTWQKCANRTINARRVNPSNPSYTGIPDELWSVGAVSDADGIVSTTRVQEGGQGWSCTEAISSANNVIIRIFVCGYSVPSSAVPAFIKAVADKVDAQG